MNCIMFFNIKSTRDQNRDQKYFCKDILTFGKRVINVSWYNDTTNARTIVDKTWMKDYMGNEFFKCAFDHTQKLCWCLFIYATVKPSRNSPSQNSHMRQFLQTWVGRGYFMAVTGSMWLLLWDICGSYKIYVAVTGSTSHSFFRKLPCMVDLLYTP